jgi:preprotein translocase subunit SecF
MFFVANRTIFFSIIGVLALVAVVSLVAFGVRFGIEFTGGTIVEVAYEGTVPEKTELETRLNSLDLGGTSLRQTGDDGFLLRTRDLTEPEYSAVREALTVADATLIEKRRATVGPVIGAELKNKAIAAIAVVSLLIILYVAIAFRHVSKPVSSWIYGVIAILVLVHDLLIPLGVFAVLGVLFGAEVDVLFVMALLTILGYSVNDTIVIFDRVRENLRDNEENNVDETFEETVGHSLSQTYARSINTSLTTLLVVIPLLVFGGTTTTWFALTLAIGIFAGTYSSLALAAPLLVAYAHKFPQKEEEEEKK